MTDIELKTLKDNIWHSADMLRAGAHFAANKYGQPRRKVFSLIQVSLNNDLPESYDRVSFVEKTNLIMNHFVDMAIQGYGWVTA